MQLVYQLFVAEVESADEEVKLVMQMTLEGIKAQERDPFTAYANRVRELNYGDSYYFKVITTSPMYEQLVFSYSFVVCLTYSSLY